MTLHLKCVFPPFSRSSLLWLTTAIYLNGFQLINHLSNNDRGSVDSALAANLIWMCFYGCLLDTHTHTHTQREIVWFLGTGVRGLSSHVICCFLTFCLQTSLSASIISTELGRDFRRFFSSSVLSFSMETHALEKKPNDAGSESTAREVMCLI